MRGLVGQVVGDWLIRLWGVGWSGSGGLVGQVVGGLVGQVVMRGLVGQVVGGWLVRLWGSVGQVVGGWIGWSGSDEKLGWLVR